MVSEGGEDPLARPTSASNDASGLPESRVDWAVRIEQFERQHHAAERAYFASLSRARRARAKGRAALTDLRDTALRIRGNLRAFVRDNSIAPLWVRTTWMWRRMLDRARESAPSWPNERRAVTGDERAAWRREANRRNQVRPVSPLMPKPTCTIIVAGGDGAHLIHLLRSLLAHASLAGINIVVVADGASNKARRVAHQYADRLPIVVVDAEALGVVRAQNRALRSCASDYVLFLAQDVVLDDDAVRRMADILADPAIGVVSVRLDGAAGLQHAGFKVYADPTAAQFLPVPLAAQVTDPGTGIEDVPAVTSEVMMCRTREMLKLGGFNEEHQSELGAVDLCLRYRLDLGLRVVCAHDIVARQAPKRRMTYGYRDLARQRRSLRLLASELGYSVRRAALSDRIRGQRLWQDDPLSVGLVGDRAQELAGAAAELGWTMVPVPLGNGASDCGTLDVIVVSSETFDLRDSCVRRPTLLTVALSDAGELERWAARPWFSEFDWVLASTPAGSGRSSAVLQRNPEFIEDGPAAVRDTLIELVETRLRIAIKVPIPARADPARWGDYHFATALRQAMSKRGHVVRIDLLADWYRPECVADDVVIVLRGRRRYRPNPAHINILWNISHPEEVEATEQLEFDHVFVASRAYARECSAGPLGGRVECLLQAYDPGLFYRDDGSADTRNDVLFVGNSRFVYRPAVFDALEAGLQVAVYGSNWDGLIPAAAVHGTHIPNETLRTYYSGCKVLLNDHWPDMRRLGFISNRLFDAAACGACIVSDPVDGLDEVFGDSVSVYDNPEHLSEIVRRLLEDDALRRSQGEAARSQVASGHTFDDRAREILTRAAIVSERRWMRGART